MKKITLNLLSIMLLLTTGWQTVNAQTFTQGNIAVFVAAASASNTTGSIIELNTTTAGQSAVNTYAINGISGASALRFSGSATSTGYLANSNDGSLLAFTGGNTTISGATNINTILTRGVGTLNQSYTFNLETTYTGTSGNQTRCATSLNNTSWYIGDQGGLYTNSASAPSPVANLRVVKSFGGIVYGAQASSTGTVIQVSTISALSGGTLTGLPGLTNNSSMQDFYLISSGSNGTAFDILYVVSATSNAAGTISKYSLVSGTWTANGSYTTTFGGFGIAAQVQGSGAYLFVSTGQGALTANSVIRLTDAAGYNATISITTANNITLYTTATGTIIKGIAFAPYTSCTAPAITSLTNTGPVCQGSTLDFNVSATGTATLSYEWSGPNGFTSTVQNPSIANATTAATGTYAVTVTNSCGSSSSSTAATVGSSLTPTISGTLTFCTGGSTVLDAGAGYTSYLWSNSQTTQTINAFVAGDYSVTVSNGVCSGTSAIVTVTEIAAAAQPDAFTASSANVASGQAGVVYTVPAVSGVTYAWSYSGTGAVISGTGNSITVEFSLTATSGTLGVTATNSCGTSAAREIVLTVAPPPPGIRITEYMYSGLGAGSAGEFVEFTNVGSTAIDMTGWSFDDNSRLAGSQSLTAFGIVQPGESVILTEVNAGTFRTNWGLCAGVKVIGNNANNLSREDEINLYDATNTLVDRLTYGDQTYSPGSIRTNLASGWVSAAGLGANQITQWTLSVTGDAEASYASLVNEKGSPGKSTRATVAFDPCFVANGAPSIVMDIVTTSNYIDGGVTVAPSTPYGLSGVISDPTDPAATLGVDFTIGDDVTPVASLIVTATSSNQTVVPNANLTLTGSNASRNIKINPANVGYANITVTVNDGTLSSSYIINFAASDPAPQFISASTAWHTGMSDGSDAIAIDNDYYISGDDELNVLNVYSRSQSGLPFASYNYTSGLNLPNPSSPEVDVEAGIRSTVNANKIYWTGSYSNGKFPYDNKPNRDRLFATTVTGTGEATTFAFSGYVNFRSELLAWGDANGYNFTASAAAGVNPKGLAGFSLEGIVFGPDNTTMYLGLRAPLVPTSLRQNAVIAPILNFETWFNNGAPAGAPTFGAPIELNLDFRGIRDIIRLSNGTYIIVAGSPIDDGGVNNLYKWSGYASDAPIAITNTVGGLLNIEGLMQINNALGQIDLTQIQIISDGGAQILYQDNNEAKDFADLNLRKFRSDVVTGIDLNICTVFTATITPAGSTTICSGSSVTLAANAGTNNSYLWSTSETSQTIAASAFQSYTVTVTSTTSGCSATSAPVAVTNASPSDFNGDNVTNNSDFLQLLGMFNQLCTGCAPDLNNDGIVNNTDFLILLGQFNQTCN